MRFGEPPDYDAPVRLLRGRDFRLLVLSNGLSSFGDELALVALTIKVADLTGSGLAIAGLLLVGILPMVLFAPVAGALVDRTETTGTLAIASLLQAAIALGLAFSQALWLILVLSFLLGTVASVASPAVFALVPKAVDEEDLTPANARMETARYVGMVAAPIAVAALAGQLGDASPVPLVVDAVTFLVIASAAASLSIRRPPAAEEPGEGERRRGEFRRGFAFVRRDPVLLIAIVVLAFTVLFAVMDNVAEIFFARNPDLLDAGNWGYGALAAAWLLGMVAGATLIAGRLPDARLAPSILVSSVVLGLAVAVAAASANIWIALPLFFVAGMGNGTGSVAIRSLIHHRAPDQVRGRVFAVYLGLATAGQLGATALGGVLVGGEGARAQQTLIIGGLGAFSVGVLGLLWFASIPGRVRAAPATTIRIPDLKAPAASASEPAPAREPERTVVEVRNITPDGELVDLTRVEVVVPEPSGNGSGAAHDPQVAEPAEERADEPRMLPSIDPRA
jgi:MFS family permease